MTTTRENVFFEARIARLESLVSHTGAATPAVVDRSGAAVTLAEKVTAFLRDLFGPQAYAAPKKHVGEDGDEEWVVEAHYGLRDDESPADLEEKHDRVLREYLALPKQLRRGILFARLAT